jgi:hypothetical protein
MALCVLNLVKSSSGMLQVGEAGSPAKNMVRNDIIMDRGGYFFAYLVNESPVNVYFDDFKVTHITGKVLEENHYYPF